MAPALVGEVEIAASLDDQSLVLPLKDFSEKLEYLGAFFGEVDDAMLSSPEDGQLGDQFASLHEWRLQEVFCVFLHNVEDVNEQHNVGLLIYVCSGFVVLELFLLEELSEGKGSEGIAINGYYLAVQLDALDVTLFQLFRNDLVEAVIEVVLGLAVPADHLQLFSSLVGDERSFSVVFDIQEDWTCLFEAKLVQIGL